MQKYLAYGGVALGSVFLVVSSFLVYGTFDGIVGGASDPTPAGVTLTVGSVIATLGAYLTAFFANWQKYEKPAVDIIRAVTGKDLTDPSTTVGELFAAITAISSWESKQEDQVLKQQAFMAVMALLSKISPEAANEINAVAIKGVNTFFATKTNG